MRRGVLVVVLLVLVVVGGFIGATIRQNHQLGEQLVADIETLRSKRFKVPRAEGQPPPLHDNGFACLANVAKTAPPVKLGSFNDPKNEFGKFARGERPLSELTQIDRDALEKMRPWIDALRGCGDADELQWVEGFEPWDHPWTTFPNASLLMHTAIDVRLLVAEGHAARALQLCTQSIETYLDWSHLGVDGAMIATTSLRKLAPLCAAAWSEVTPDVRKDVAARWVLLPSRMASDAEVFEVHRVSDSIVSFAILASSESQAKFPVKAIKAEPIPGTRPIMMRYWPVWDSKMRAVGAAKDDESFVAAERAFDHPPWWMFSGYPFLSSSLRRERVRVQSGRDALAVLGSLASGSPLPATAIENGGVITLPGSQEEEPLVFKR